MPVRARSTLVVVLLTLGVAAFAPSAVWAASPSPQAVAWVTAATTGRADAGSLAPRAVCPPAGPGRATCYAKALALRSSGGYVHPSLKPAVSPSRFFAAGQHPAPTTSSAAAAAAGSDPQPGTPAYLQQVYDLAYLSQTQGAGDTVAIVDAYDDPTAESDLATYRAQFGLPACTVANGCFRKVNQTGQQGGYPGTDSGWSVEVSLDLDAVSALCPLCHILLVEAASDYTTDLLTAQSTAAALGANQISDSWGAPQTTPPGGSFTFPGVATVAAGGDSGYLGAAQNQYPAALAGVTAAGGTTLTPAASGSARGYSEAAWSGAGSGCDAGQAKPAWQSDGGCAGRAYDDLSADADPATGMEVYFSGDGGWLVVGGTSEASPLIAAYYAITGALAQTPQWAYQHQAQLNDPAAGMNGSCPSAIVYICSAAGGYDGPTGAGSISGAAVAGGPGIGGPAWSNSYATAATSTAAQLSGGIYPNGSATTWWVQYGTSTAYGQQTAPVDLGSGSAPVSVTASLAGLVPGTLYHYRLVAQNGFGTTYGYDYTLTTAPPAAPAPASSATPTPAATTWTPSARVASAKSKATIYRVSLNGARATVTVSCRAASACRVRVRLTVGGVVLARAGATISAHRTATVRLKLGRRAASLVHAHLHAARVSVLESSLGADVAVAAHRLR
jgi:hypothetical protein